MGEMPTMQEMLKAGVHFGHQVSKRHPKMDPYIFGFRNGVNIIDLDKTGQKLEAALDFVKKVTSEGGLVVFVGSKKQAQPIIKKYAMECGMPYVTNRWIGGTLTNFDIINKVIRGYKDLKARQASGELLKYTKKEQAGFAKDLLKMEQMVGGLLNLNKIPAAVFIVDLKMESTARVEAESKKVPIVAICDTNVNPDGIAYPIPANDDATKSIEMITHLLAQACKEGVANKKIEPVKTAPAKTPVVRVETKSETKVNNPTAVAAK